MFRSLLPSLGVVLVLASAVCAPASAQEPANPLPAQSEKAWEMTWKRFFHPKTEIFYDYLSSFEPGKELAHLPTAEEVKRQYPNPCGYGTGMEDGMILGGAMLSVLVDRHAVTKEADLKEKALQVFRGVERCTTLPSAPGFVARAICPADGEGFYINTSRDQYTHAVHGLWKYYQSPLCDEPVKVRIRRILSDIADRMTRTVIPENDYDSLRADNQRDPLSISRMWNVQAHEAARLPMIYAAAWDATRDDKYLQLCRKYLVPAIEQSAGVDPKKPAYALLQVQCSLELLRDLEADPALKAQIEDRLKLVAGMARKRATQIEPHLFKLDLKMLGPDWRTVPEWKNQKGYIIPQWGTYRKVWHESREVGEAALVALMTAQPDETAVIQGVLKKTIGGMDYEHYSGCGIVYHLAAYWKARRLGLL